MINNKNSSGNYLILIVLTPTIEIMRWIRQERPLQLRAISMKRQGMESHMGIRLATIMLRKNTKMTIGATLEERPKIIRWLLASPALRQGYNDRVNNI